MILQYYIDEMAKCLMEGAEDPASPAHARMLELIEAMVRAHAGTCQHPAAHATPPLHSTATATHARMLELIDAMVRAHAGTCRHPAAHATSPLHSTATATHARMLELIDAILRARMRPARRHLPAPPARMHGRFLRKGRSVAASVHCWLSAVYAAFVTPL
jgi:hypothetical protein